MHVDNTKLCQCHVIVIAVKPYLVAKVMEDIKGYLEPHHVIVSLAAGVALADLCKVSVARIHHYKFVVTINIQINIEAWNTHQRLVIL